MNLRILSKLLLIPALAVAVAHADDRAGKAIATLKSDASLHDKGRACQELGLLGSREAVPVLAGLLADDKLASYARDALEAIPDPVADAALRSALESLHGNALIGVVNSLGVRRDAKSVKALNRIASDPASGAASEALLALGRIANDDAAAILQKTLDSGAASLRTAAAEACLLVAERRLAAKQNSAAVRIYDAVRAADLPKQIHLSATLGAMISRQSKGVSLMIEALKSDDIAMRNTGLCAMRLVNDAKTTRALIAALPSMKPGVQALMIPLFKYHADASRVAAIEKQAENTSAEVRVAALNTLGLIGQGSSAAVLLDAVSSNRSADEVDAALLALAQLPASETDSAILQVLPAVSSDVRAKLIGILSVRKTTGASAALLKFAAGSDVTVAAAALRALATLSTEEDLPALIAMLSRDDEAIRELAERAVVSCCGRNPGVAQSSGIVLGAYETAKQPAARISLMRVLRQVDASADACRSVQAALKDSDAGVRDAALRVLADWPGPAPVAALLDIAENDSDVVRRTLALRGVVRIATDAAQGRGDAQQRAAGWLAQAGRSVRDDDGKRLLLSGLGRMSSAESLRMILPYLDDTRVRAEAAAAALEIAPALIGTCGAEVRMAMERIVALPDQPALREKAADLLKRLPAASASQSLFDGRTLDGWSGDTNVWMVRDDAIIGGSLKGNKQNEFLATVRSHRNFVLTLEYKLVGTEGFVNGGVQFRSVRIKKPANEMSGYQADIGAGHSGCLYDESRRNKFLARGADDQIKRLEKSGDWNRYEVRCEGPRIRIVLNGETTVDYTEADTSLPQDGLIALQIHGGNKAEISFRSIVLAELP